MYRWILIFLMLPAIAWGQHFTSGQSNTLSDTGTFNGTEGFGLAGGKTGVALKVKGLLEGSNITITTSGDSALLIAGPAAGGTADSMGVDTDGNGTVDSYLYSTTAGAFHIKRGSNITLTVAEDTVTIAGPAGGGTSDSLGVDTNGDGTVDNYLYSTTSMFAMLREGTGMILSVQTDTLYFATTLGTSVSSGEIVDQTISKDDMDTTGSHFVFDNAYEGTSAEADSQYSTHNWVKVEIAGYVAKDDSGTWDEVSAKLMLNQASIGNASDSSEADSGLGTIGFVKAEIGDSLTEVWTDLNAVDGSEITDQTIKGDDVDSTAEDFVFDDPFKGTSAEPDSELATLLYVKTQAGDSAQAYDDFSELSGSVADGQIANDAVDGGNAGEIQDQTITKDDLDSTSANFVFDDPFKGTSAVPDSELATFEYTQIIAGDSAQAYDDFSELSGSVADAQIAAGAVDGGNLGEIADQSIIKDDIDTTSSNIPFDGAYHVTSGEADSAYITAKTAGDSTAALRDGDTWTGVHDFGGATSVEIPNSDNPTTDANGEIAGDNNSNALEVYIPSESESGLIPFYRHWSIPILLPDSVQTYSPNFHVLTLNPLVYPFGIEIDSISIRLDADAAYSMVIEEWSGADPIVYQNDVSTVTTGANDTYAIEAPDTDGNLDAGDTIILDLPTTDVPKVTVEIYYHITEGN